jgi:hypothetical protein
MKKQTAVEWLIDRINKDYEENGRLRYAYISNAIMQAKELEKEQELKKWIEAWSLGYDSGFNNGVKKFKQQISYETRNT